MNYNPPAIESAAISERAAVDATPIVLIRDIEILPVQPGETITVPVVDGVNFWYLMSDFALEKVNKIQIDRSRMITNE